MVEVCGRTFPLSVDAFFQANKYLVGRLYEHVRDLAREIPAGRALDAFGGAGLFAGALLDAGHRVTTVEAGRSAIATRRPRSRSGRTDRVGTSWPRPFLPSRPRLDPIRSGRRRSSPSRARSRARRSSGATDLSPHRLCFLRAGHSGGATWLRCSRRTTRSSRRVSTISFGGTHRIEAIVILGRKGSA